jgi:hypothetical protein
MAYYYSLRINFIDKSIYDSLTKSFGEGREMADGSWGIEIQKGNEDNFDFIRHFTELLESKAEVLKSLSVSTNDISLWLLYEYENQCNLEFSPDQLSGLASKKIALCISCWEG